LLKDENILYIKFISIEEIEDLITKFVNGYKLGEFDDLYNHISDFCSDIGNDILENYEDRGEFKSEVDDIYFNVIYPTGILKYPSEKSISIGNAVDSKYINLYTGIGKRYYSTQRSRFYSTKGIMFKKRNFNTYRVLSNNNNSIYKGYMFNSLKPSYTAILDVIKSNNLSDFEKQRSIEEILREYWKIEVYNFIKDKGLIGNKVGLNILVRQLKNLNEDIIQFLNTPILIKHKEYIKIIKEVDSTLILSIVMGKVIPFVVKYANYEEQPVTNLFKNTGQELLNEVIRELYSRDLKNNNIPSDLKYSQYKLDKIKNNMLDEEKLIKLGCDLIIFLSERSNFFEVKELKLGKNISKRVIIPKGDFVKLLENIIYIDTEELPMIIPPLHWKIDNNGKIIEYGGTILNNKYEFKSLTSISVKNIAVKSMKYNNSIINSVNRMASTEYIINKQLLDIITKKEYMKGDKPLIYFRPHSESNRLSKYIKDKNFIKSNEITVYNSKYIYETSIINIAKLMCNTESFYFTNFIDWRGRFYTSNCSLNIQGGELARALLLFKKGEVLNKNGIYALKIYIANAFGLDKKSKDYRVDWVDSNLNDIINSPDNNLWLSAEEPLIFLACALELKEYNKNSQFISKLPILLDATCNGIQHLSAIANDINLAQKVNITSSSDNCEPNDIYTDLIKPIKDDINSFIKNNPEHYNLSKLNITRKLIKRGIMTITYGVTVKGILNQLLVEHFIKYDLVNNHYLYKPKDVNIGDVSLTYKDLYKLSEIIYNCLFKIHPVLENIMEYFHNIVKLLNDLELPVQWITPYGLEITQKYAKYTKYDITTKVYGKRSKIVLRKAVINKNGEVSMNCVKQINSFIPNFIHSMDGSNIVLLLNNIKKKYSFDVITIHDCFGVQANYCEILSQLVKESFILIYGDKKCIENFHNHIIENIKAVYKVYDNIVINKDGKEFKLPQKPIIGEMDLKAQLSESKYFIN
jgi:hypothetical protein